MKLYFDCTSGVSSDMILNALTGLGADTGAAQRLRIEEEGHSQHSHGGHAHHHSHRSHREIRRLIEESELPQPVKDIMCSIYLVIARAEAKVHESDVENVHFHEVGRPQAIRNIAGIAVGLEDLGVQEILCSELHDGKGFIECSHGRIPVPVPAVVNIAQAHDLKLHLTEVEGELVTPTGAAIVAAVRTDEQLPKHFHVKKIGIGAGKRDYESPGILRAMLIEETGTDKDWIFRLETNIDDCSGEAMGYVMKRLMKAGAKDVHYIPVFMKKNRPAYELVVLCEECDIPEMEQIIFEETTTIGIRRMEMERTVLKREQMKMKTELGEASVKMCTLPNGKHRCYPDYEDVKKIAKRRGISYDEVYRQIRQSAEESRGNQK